jgi:hypothetical protein
MRKWIAAAIAIALAVLGLACTLRAQSSYTVYSQTTLNCQLTTCTDAQFTPPGDLSYAFPFRTMGQQNVAGQVTWNGATYTDAVASMTWQGYGNHYPYGTWEVRGTFNAGTGTVIEHFYCYKSCGAHSNHDGEVIIAD